MKVDGFRVQFQEAFIVKDDNYAFFVNCNTGKAFFFTIRGKHCIVHTLIQGPPTVTVCLSREVCLFRQDLVGQFEQLERIIVQYFRETHDLSDRA